MTDSYPKHVTIDLKKPTEINLVRYGVPNIGSTKTVAVSVSEDGTKFTEVGVHVFGQNKAERSTATFKNTTARYVRLTFKDYHDAEVGGYSKFFGFLSEVEVYKISRNQRSSRFGPSIFAQCALVFAIGLRSDRKDNHYGQQYNAQNNQAH